MHRYANTHTRTCMHTGFYLLLLFYFIFPSSPCPASRRLRRPAPTGAGDGDVSADSDLPKRYGSRFRRVPPLDLKIAAILTDFSCYDIPAPAAISANFQGQLPRYASPVVASPLRARAASGRHDLGALRR